MKQSIHDLQILQQQTNADQEIISFLDIHSQDYELLKNRFKGEINRMKTFLEFNVNQNNHVVSKLVLIILLYYISC